MPSERALASSTLGNDTTALEDATAALTNATKALQDAVQQLESNNTEDVSNDSRLSIETSREKYAIGAPIEIFGNLTTTNRTMANSPIKIIISPTSESEHFVNMTLNVITLNVINGSYFYRGLIPFKEAGIYQVNATTTDNKTASAFIELVDLFSTYSIHSIIAALAFFIWLIIIMFLYGRKRKDKVLQLHKANEDKLREKEDPFNDRYYYLAEIGRFVALTGISFSLILSLMLLEVEVNPNGPIGLVNVNSNGELNNNSAFTEWAINIGGSRNDNYESGLIIPVYVIILGLIGGFMRYLHKAYAKTEYEHLDKEKKKLTEDEGTPSGFVHHSLGELSDILIAPILAIALWFILHQEIQSVFLLAALSLTVGLATPNIILGLKRFATTTSGSTPAETEHKANGSTPGSTPAGVG